MTDRFETAEISAIIPIGSRHGDMAALYREYRSALASLGRTCEFILVLDGPRPKAEEQIEQLLRAGEKLTVIALTRTFGEATALMAGFQLASSLVIVTLPADYQVVASEIGKVGSTVDITRIA